MNMSFIDLKKALQDNFNEISKDASYLFEVGLDMDILWDLYLDSFPAGANKVFRERREYDCSCCRQFVRSFGNVVAIKDNQVKTIWDFQIDSEKYQPVISALSKYVKSKAVENIYVGKFANIGTDINREQLESKEIIEWNHFFVKLPDRFIDRTHRSIGEIRGAYRETKNVFKRSLEELTEDSILTTLELIEQGSLHRGEEWKNVLTQFLELKQIYDKLQESEKDNFTWEQSVKVGISVGRIKNHSIGTLLTDISEDVDLNAAVTKYEKMVAGENYKRTKTIYTKRQQDDAIAFMEKEGFLESLSRRYGNLDDISINNILFSNKDSAKRIQGLEGIFEEMSQDIAADPRKFSKVEEISIKDFIENVLPTTKNVEVYLENKHAPNMVSLIAPQNKDAKTMFKWDNLFGWAYSGNITESSMKDRVKSAGGSVDGVLRFSIQWNDENYNPNDFDAHCIEPGNYEIYFSNKRKESPTGGMLDVDIIHPERGVPSVENITWANADKMKKGIYKFFVHNYSNNGGRDGFKAEIEFNGQIFEFYYNKELRQGEKVQVAEVTFDGTSFSIKSDLSSVESSREVWGLKTNSFIPASVVMYSPNYWNEQQGIGHKHYFFMLKDCVNPEKPNGFYNEFLKNELNQYRKFFEALGEKMAVKDIEDQLSGLGFSSTKRNDLLVKVKGQSERILKIKF